MRSLSDLMDHFNDYGYEYELYSRKYAGLRQSPDKRRHIRHPVQHFELVCVEYQAQHPLLDQASDHYADHRLLIVQQ